MMYTSKDLQITNQEIKKLKKKNYTKKKLDQKL